MKSQEKCEVVRVLQAVLWTPQSTLIPILAIDTERKKSPTEKLDTTVQKGACETTHSCDRYSGV
jgi:hypothetical protein